MLLISSQTTLLSCGLKQIKLPKSLKLWLSHSNASLKNKESTTITLKSKMNVYKTKLRRKAMSLLFDRKLSSWRESYIATKCKMWTWMRKTKRLRNLCLLTRPYVKIWHRKLKDLTCCNLSSAIYWLSTTSHRRKMLKIRNHSLRWRLELICTNSKTF